MAIINNLSNAANVTYDGNPINSNSVNTVLLLAPTIIKAVDKLVASIGETLTYTVTIANLGLNALTNLPFADALPAGSEYVIDSFRVNSVEVTPTITGNDLSYTIPNIPALGSAIISFQVTIIGGTI